MTDMIIDSSFVPESALYVLAKIQQGGHQSYIVGGSVRDAIMGRAPHDIDISSDKSTGDIMSLFGGESINRDGQWERQVIPSGPMFGLLQKGKSVTLSDGRIINPAQVMGEARRGTKIVISGDTTPCENTINAASGADVLIHESTFIDGEEDRAAKLGHSTSRQAAEVAKAAKVKRLILTHFSKRHSDDVSELVRQARSVFEHSIDACDGMSIKI